MVSPRWELAAQRSSAARHSAPSGKLGPPNDAGPSRQRLESCHISGFFWVSEANRSIHTDDPTGCHLFGTPVPLPPDHFYSTTLPSLSWLGTGTELCCIAHIKLVKLMLFRFVFLLNFLTRISVIALQRVFSSANKLQVRFLCICYVYDWLNDY